MPTSGSQAMISSIAGRAEAVVQAHDAGLGER